LGRPLACPILYSFCCRNGEGCTVFEKLFSATQKIRVGIIKHIPFSAGDVFYLFKHLLIALVILSIRKKAEKALLTLLV
jgi:hypothetical protein